MAQHTPGPIARFLNEASERIVTGDGNYPFDAKIGNVVIGWLRARIPADDAAPELFALAEAVAAHFAGTDAPLGEQARAVIAKARS